jgi:hypothetical protein
VASETISQAAERISSRADVTVEVERRRQELGLTDAQAAAFANRLTKELENHTIRQGVKGFSDDNPVVRRLVDEAVPYFRGNPRELKRFVTAFRFQYFLMYARRAQELDAPNAQQVLRWTILTVKWPDMARWLRRGGEGGWNSADGEPPAPTTSDAPGVNLRQPGQRAAAPKAAATRLSVLEAIAAEATSRESWHKLALERLGLEPKDAAWLNDHELYRFYRESTARLGEDGRLSDGAGKGLW